MAVNIRQLETGGALSNSDGRHHYDDSRPYMNRADTRSSDGEPDDVDLTALLEKYAPETESEPEADRQPFKIAPASRKRPRSTEDEPEPSQFQPSARHNVAPIPGLTNDFASVTLPDGGPQALATDQPAFDPTYLSFMQLLQSMSQRGQVTLPPAMPNNYWTSDTNTLAPFGRPSNGDGQGTYSGYDTSQAMAATPLPAPTYLTSMSPLLDMVDWNASLENCAGLYTNGDWSLGGAVQEQNGSDGNTQDAVS